MRNLKTVRANNKMTKVIAADKCARHQIASSSLASLLLLACLALLPQPPLNQVGRFCTSQAAVIRPTIFSDLPPPDAVAQQQPAAPPLHPASSSSSQQQQQQQQPNNQQQAPQVNEHTPTHHHPTHWHHSSPHPADAPANSQAQAAPQVQAQQQQQQKINPLKSRFCTGPDGQRLDHSLGLQSFAIDDLSLSASSSSNEQVRPHLARLNLDTLGGAWCPMNPISLSNFGKEWIQVKLNRSFVVSAIETQGRFALGSGKESVPSYQVEYSRNNGHTWHKWKDFRGSNLLPANDDVQTVVRNELSPPIVGANVIRLLPYSQKLRTVCLRFELYGCQYDEGAPVSYTTNDGVIEPRWGHLIDYTYDGLRHRSGQLSNFHLSGGLGQLVDGVKGPDNFQFNNGFEWVGWKSMNGHLVIEFTFKTLRNFTGALFHSNNLFSAGVEVFKEVDVHYGIDVAQSMESLRDTITERRRRTGAESGGLARSARQLAEGAETDALQPAANSQTVWSSDVLSIEYEPDKKAESARPVTVHLKQRLANKLRFVLRFASKWILISEVEFLSHPVELMSLASLNEELTPKLMASLQQAKSYDEYVAILREHQMRRIAADHFLMLSGATTGATMDSSNEFKTPPEETTPADDGSTTQGSPNSLQDQPREQEPDNGVLASKAVLNQPQWPALSGKQITFGQTNFLTVPETNPLHNLSPKLSPQEDELASLQQQQGKRTVGLLSVLSLVFVGVFGLVAVIFIISSHRLRQASRTKLTAAQAGRHLGLDSKNFLSGVFGGGESGLAPTSAQDLANSSPGSLGYHTHRLALHQNAHQPANYNPLFANSSSRSSEGSLRKPGGGPLSTLKRLAALTSGGSATSSKRHRASEAADSLFSSPHAGHNQNQLLVSIKDSMKPQSSSISTQLILGLNQANPLAHQQIYNTAATNQQQLYGQQTNYSANTNSISLASSSTAGTGGDYATPDIQPIVRNRCQMSLMLNSNEHLRQSNRLIQRPTLMAEHNYEQINSDQAAPVQRNFNATTGTLAGHQRTSSNQQGACHPFSSMTSARPQLVPRQQQQGDSSHYYYADTDASKNCLR